MFESREMGTLIKSIKQAAREAETWPRGGARNVEQETNYSHRTPIVFKKLCN